MDFKKPIIYELDDIKLIEFDKKNIKIIGLKSGVYFLFDENVNVLYIGKSIDLKQRISQHIRGVVPQSRNMIHEIKWFGYISRAKLPIHLSLNKCENMHICKYKPLLNNYYKSNQHIDFTACDGW